MLGFELLSRSRPLLLFTRQLLQVLIVLMCFVIAPAVVAVSGTRAIAFAAAIPCEPIWKSLRSLGTATSGNVWNAVTVISYQDIWLIGTGFDGNKTVPTSAHWNGSKWKSVAMPSVGSVENHLYAIDGNAPDDVWTAGIYRDDQEMQSHFFLHWDGKSWQQAPSPQIVAGESGIQGVTAISANNVWAVGFMIQNPFAQSPIVESLIMHWDGTAWSIYSSPNPGTRTTVLRSISGRSFDDVWAVGHTGNDKGETQPLAMHFDGIHWTIVSTPEFSSGYNVLTDVATISSDDGWAVGQYVDSATNKIMNLTIHWDGSNWTIVPSPTPHPSVYDFPLRAVTAIDEQNVWTVGADYRPKKGFSEAFTLRWDGKEWIQVPVSQLGEFANYLSDIAAAGPNDIWTVGSFIRFSTKTIPLVQHYGPPIVPGKPVSPAKKAVVAKRKVTLDWQDLDCATRYQVTVKEKNPNDDTIFEQTDLTMSRVKTPKLAKDTKYVWSVRGCNADGCGFWSKWRSFQIAP